MRTFRSRSFFTQSECKIWYTYVDPSAYEVFRLVLRVWDSIAPSVTGVASDRPLQPVEELSKVKDLIGTLAYLLKTFEVAGCYLLTSLMSLTAVISSTTVSPPTADLTIFAR